MTCAFDIYVHNSSILYKFDFSKDGEKIEDLPRNRSTLVFDHVLTKDYGNYSCQVTTNFTVDVVSDEVALSGKNNLLVVGRNKVGKK